MSAELRPHFSLRPYSSLSSSEKDRIEGIYEESYGNVGLWMKHREYQMLTVPTTTDVATITISGKIHACINMNGKRVGVIAVAPEGRSMGLVAELFKGLGEGAWISISMDERAKAMLASATARDVPLIPVNDPLKIVELFEKTKIRLPKDYIFQQVEDEFLTKRLARKGIQQDVFTVVSKTNSLHGLNYRQIVLQVPKQKPLTISSKG